MDRVNRRFLVIPTLIAIPAALLMASLSIGTHPEVPDSHPSGFRGGVQNAVARSDRHPADSIRQVIGKQPESPQTRRALFGGSSDSTSLPSRRSQTRSSSPEPQGLFQTLFGNNGNDNSDSGRGRSSQTAQSEVPTPSPEDVDWDGIPFHNVGRSKTGRSSSQGLARPIRSTTAKPIGSAAVGSAVVNRSEAPVRTRVIRGGSEASPSPQITSKSTDALVIPKPPADSEAMPKVRTFSSQDSSRRSKPVAVAGSSRNSSVASIYGSNSKPEPDYRSDEVADLVPRVRRRLIKAKPAPATVAKTESADSESVSEPDAVNRIAKQPSPAKAETKKLAAAKTVVKQEPKPEPTVASKATLEPPTATIATATIAKAAVKKSQADSPVYSTPVDPKTDEVPPAPAYAASGGITQQPSTADVAADPTMPMDRTNAVSGVPAASVSHRAGPPAAAFVPIRQPSPQFEDRSPRSDNLPVDHYAQDNFNAVGSGVAKPSVPTRSSFGSNTPSFQNSPVYETAMARPRDYDQRDYRQRDFGQPTNNQPNYDQRGYQDPYRSREAYQSPRMMTFGQQVADGSTALQQLSQQEPSAIRSMQPATRPSHETAAYPMHPIPGHQANQDHSNHVIKRSTSGKPAADNFVDASGNRMRSKTKAVAKIPASGPSIVASELPGIRVVTHGPSAVMIRQNNEYEIRVENRGSIDANGVLVRALIPDWADVQGKNATVGDIDSQGKKGAERLVWTIDHLPAGQSEQMFVRLTAARSGTYNLDVDWTLLPQRSVAQVQVHEPRLELAIEGPDQVVYGASQTYKVRVLNPGDGMAPNVVFTLSPNSTTPQSQRIGDIPAGKEAQFEVELTAQDLGELKIQGLATGDLELRAEKAKTILVSAAKLEAILGGPELKYQNTEAVYNLQIQNLGTATSRGVMASLKIPSGVKFLGGIDGVEQLRDRLRWEIAELAPGASRDYQFRCDMVSTGSHLIDFECKGSAAGQASVAIETNVESIADLVLTIKDPPAPAPIGSDVAYEIIVKNRGSREAKNVKAIAQFSHGIEPLRVEGQSGEVVTGQVLFDTIPRIGAGEEVRLRVIAQAETAGNHRFCTEIRSGDTVLVAEEATHFMSPRSDRVSRRSSDAPLSR